MEATFCYACDAELVVKEEDLSISFRSVGFGLSEDTYIFACPHCGKINSFDVDEIPQEIINRLPMEREY